MAKKAIHISRFNRVEHRRGNWGRVDKIRMKVWLTVDGRSTYYDMAHGLYKVLRRLIALQ
jgi:hypothetical protein